MDPKLIEVQEVWDKLVGSEVQLHRLRPFLAQLYFTTQKMAWVVLVFMTRGWGKSLFHQWKMGLGCLIFMHRVLKFHDTGLTFGP